MTSHQRTNRNGKRRSLAAADCVSIGAIGLALLISPAIAPAATPLGSAFTYQAQVKMNGSPLNDSADFMFTLHDAPTSGLMVGAARTVSNVNVVNGLMTVELDWGGGVLSGEERWLEIAVRSPHDPTDTAPFTTLDPRQRLSATPYALQTRGIFVDDSSNVGIGTTSPVTKLDVRGDVQIPEDHEFQVKAGTRIVRFGYDAASATGFVTADGRHLALVSGFGEHLRLQGGADGILFNIQTAAGNQTTKMRLHPDGTLGVAGRVRAEVVEITGGSDLAEPFRVTPPGAGSDDLKAGMVVVIDADDPGRLKVATKPYDRKVAGIISGANGIKPGLMMRAEGTTLAEGDHPVALSGRVWCWCDARHGGISPGDLLTTSATPGHARKVTDHAKAQGAIIGKAMTALAGDRGLVLVLVSLQ